MIVATLQTSAQNCLSASASNFHIQSQFCITNLFSCLVPPMTLMPFPGWLACNSWHLTFQADAGCCWLCGSLKGHASQWVCQSFWWPQLHPCYSGPSIPRLVQYAWKFSGCWELWLASFSSQEVHCSTSHATNQPDIQQLTFGPACWSFPLQTHHGPKWSKVL